MDIGIKGEIVMNVQTLKQKLFKKDLNNFYVFLGEETVIRDKFVKAIAKVVDKECEYVEDLKTLIRIMSVKSFMKCNKLYILKEDKSLLKSEKIWDKLKKLIGQNSLIVVYNKLDKRGKFYKKFNNDIVEFEKLNNNQLLKYVFEQLNIRKEHAEELVEYCNNDYGQLMLEIDKINCLSKSLDVNKETAFIIAMDEGLIFRTLKSQEIDFIDAVITRDIEKSFELLKDLIDLKVSEMYLLSLLYRNFRNILLIQAEEPIGVSNYVIYNLKDKTDYYYIEELIRNLKIIQSVESGIKRGLVESEFALDYCLISILKEEEDERVSY
jgi:DNA polymerase III delta subunit